MTRIVKRSVTIARHRTSISLEDEFWSTLKDIADKKGLTINQLVTQIDQLRGEQDYDCGLSSAIRVFILREYRQGS